MPSLSKRISIAWNGSTPFEDTDTLVVVGHTYFVDVRVKRTTGDLDWALAGIKEWIHKEPDPPKARFTPILTSHSSSGQLADEGTFSELPNGDSLEVGVMYDPEDGKIKPYEEVWRDLPAVGIAFILEASEDRRSKVDSAWIAQMGDCQLMVAKLIDGTFAAWTAIKDSTSSWKTLNSVGEQGIVKPIDIPEGYWKVGETIESDGKLKWVVKECFMME